MENGTGKKLFQNAAIALHQVGMIYHYKGEYDRALEQYEKAKEIFEKIGDIANLAKSFGQMGNLQAMLENYTQALRYSLQAHNIFKKIGSPYAKGTINNISIVKEKLPPEEFEAVLKEFGIEEGEGE